MATRADIEAILVQRLGLWLAAASLPVTYAGANAALNDPIGSAIRASRGTTADPALITSTDVQTVASADFDQMVDIAEYRTLISIYQNYKKVDGKAGPVEGKADQLAQRMHAAIADKRAQLSADYGIGGYSAFSVTLTRTDGYSDLQAELDAA